ncbi:tRNA (guanine(10)-N(2))-dimethyltransferase [[Eubacterium] cellulosolvens]
MEISNVTVDGRGFKIITEGATKLLVAKTAATPTSVGPGNAKVPVFYNPAMEFSRDLSILVLEQFLTEFEALYPGKQVKLLDGLAGTGIRGVRMVNEIELIRSSNGSITINDYNPLAYKIILKNIDLNKLTNVNPSNREFNELLSRNRYDYIDIDPFGSPINYLDSGTRMLRNNGLLALTATDTAALFGRYPKTCLRRYDALSCRTGYSHELGPRILMGSCVRTAARYNLGLRPLLVHATDHYYRLYLQGKKGRGSADDSLAELGYVIQYNNTNKFEILHRKDLTSVMYKGLGNESTKASDKRAEFKLIGPLWLGKIYKREFLKKLDLGSHAFGTRTQLLKLLGLWLEEADAPLGFYDANLLASELKVSTPPLSKILTALTTQGYSAYRTHFKLNSFKTDADFEDVMRVLKEIS